MRKQALALMACLIFVALFAGIAATSASAQRGNLNPCTNCHALGFTDPVVTEVSHDAADNVTYSVTAAGATCWVVFQGDTRIANNADATATGGTFTVPAGKTYTIFAAKPGTQMADVTMGKATVTPQSNVSSFKIAVTAGANGSVSPAGATVSVATGANQTFTFTPSAGYSVADVKVDGASVGAVTSYTFSNVTADHTLNVTFALSAAIHTITASAGANGTISPAGPQTATALEDFSVTITPDAGYYLDTLTVDGAAVPMTTKPYVFTFSKVAANHTIAATFAATPAGILDIVTTAGPHGAVFVGSTLVIGNYTWSMAPGSSVYYEFIPDPGYVVDSVEIDNNPAALDADGGFEFLAVDRSHAIDVTFAPKSTLTRPAKIKTVKHGGKITIKGSLKPARAQTIKLVLQKKVAKTWKGFKTISVKTAANGSYKKALRMTKKGSYRVHATVNRAAAYTAATSAWRTFRVQ